MRKIYVVGSAYDYANWMQGELTKDLKNCDLVCFTGGCDVDPSLYNKAANPTTFSNIDRDIFEKEIFKQARALNKYIIGICRGSQFLCVMNGGTLVQNQDNPSYFHDIDTYDGKNLIISSTHHQAAYPFDLPKDNYKILGWTNNICGYHQGETENSELNPPKECEIVHYPKTKCIGVQGHPEYEGVPRQTILYLQKMLDKFMEDKL